MGREKQQSTKSRMKVAMMRFGKPFSPEKQRYEKRKTMRNAIIFLLLFVIATTGITILIEKIIRNTIIPGQEETWAASVASYWGGIIGGIISGILAFIGVFWTIRYYKDSDAKKERAAIQPFLHITLDRDVHMGEGGIGFSLGNLDKKEIKRDKINVEIKNLGNGFATTLVIRNGENIGGLKYNRVISVGDVARCFFMVDPECLDDGLDFAC